MLLIAAEVLFVAILAGGVALWSVPAALVLVGVLGVVACERRAAAAKPAPKPGRDA